MSKYQEMKNDRMAAMKDRSNPVARIQKNILTLLLGELDGIAKDKKIDVSDDMVVQSCKKLVKANSETIKAMHSDDLVKENEFLEKYLPTQLSEDELRKIITDLEPKNIGQVMGFLGKNHKGKFDGGLASSLAKGILAK